MFKTVDIPLLVPRDDAKTDEDKRSLLEALIDCGSLTKALARVNVSPSTCRKWRLEDAEYAAAFEIALRDGTRMALEAAGIERALHSSDALLMFFLKALDRDLYDDTQARESAAKKKTGIKITIVDEKGNQLENLIEGKG